MVTSGKEGGGREQEIEGGKRDGRSKRWGKEARDGGREERGRGAREEGGSVPSFPTPPFLPSIPSSHPQI